MVAAAANVGVRELLTIGTDLDTSRAALRLGEVHNAVQAAIGIHPTRLAAHHHEKLGRQLQALLEWCTREEEVVRPVAIGEVGLDDDAPDRPAQERFLAECLALAAEHGLPLVLHVVGHAQTHEAALRLVRQRPEVRVVAHYFVGGPDLARRYLDDGCWLSVGRPVTRASDAAVRAAVPRIPADRLLLETDTYPLPGRTTEPRDVAAVCAAVAELRGDTYAEVARTTTAAYRAFIGG